MDGDNGSSYGSAVGGGANNKPSSRSRVVRLRRRDQKCGANDKRNNRDGKRDSRTIAAEEAAAANTEK